MAASAKNCRKCKTTKANQDFSPSKKNKDGLASYCKACMRIVHAEFRLGRGQTPRRVVVAGHAYCPDCRTAKALTEFPRNAATRSGRGHYCLHCHNVRTRENVIANHGSTRSYHLKRRYGLTETQVDEMLAAQGGLCAICRTEPAAHVDHCHLTGEVRGLLCFTCNVGLGNFGDSIRRMRLAVDYLEGHQSTDPAVLEGFAWDWTTGA